jgi:hypothetical protein
VVRTDEVAVIMEPVVASAVERVVDMAQKPNLLIPCKLSWRGIMEE